MSKFRRGVAMGLLCTSVAIFAASAASAQTPYNAATTAVPIIPAQGGVLSAAAAPVVAPQVLSLQVSQPAPLATGRQASVTGLAFTGADVITLLMIAVPLVALGFTLTRKARPRQTAQG